MLEAIEICERLTGRELNYTIVDEPRVGDHRWYISDLSDFEREYPAYEPEYGIEEVLD